MAYALILGQCNEELNRKLQARKYWETETKNHSIGIRKSIKELLIIIKTVYTQPNQYLNKIKMWSASNKTRKSLCRRLLFLNGC